MFLLRSLVGKQDTKCDHFISNTYVLLSQLNILEVVDNISVKKKETWCEPERQFYLFLSRSAVKMASRAAYRN